MAAVAREEAVKIYLSQRILVLAGEITQSLVNEVREGLRVLDAQSTDPIKILFHSNGGDVACGLYLYDDIRICRCEVIGIVVGDCNSMATVILQACSKRLATPHSRFFPHNMKATLKIRMDGKTHYEQYQRLIASSERVRERYLAVLRAGMKRSENKVQSLLDEMDHEDSNSFYADRAKKEGLIDEVLDLTTFKLLVPDSLQAPTTPTVDAGESTEGSAE